MIAAAAVVAAALALAGVPKPARAQSTAAPSPSASPSSSPAPQQPYGLRIASSAYTTYIDTAASGPGLTPPEGPGFASGSPLSPMTPYDTFSSAPQTPGEAGIAQLDLTGRYTGKRYDASAVLGIGAVTGSTQNAAYWSEDLLPALNPHLGFTHLPYQIGFATHAGQDDASAAIVSPLYGSFGAHDGSWSVRGGFFNLRQTLRFVFIQPPLTNVTPAIGMSTPETLGDGSASLDSWPSPEPGLPLHGIDATAHYGNASFEATNAALPALPGTSARATILSAVIDRGEGTQYAAQYLHAVTGGSPIQTTTLYGADATTNPGPQGPLPTSTLGGQVETIAGVRAAFHLGRAFDGLAEAGRTWYDAANVLEPGTNAPGGFYHAGTSAHYGHSTYEIDAYRFEGRYAEMILPYGTPENVWSVGWSWPGVWLKSTYQLVDNLQNPGSNRQGYRLRYSGNAGPVEVRASLATFHQIVPATLAVVHQTGFVDGFFLPQFDDAGTLGEQHQYALYVTWHPRFGDVTVDYVDDLMHRGFVSSHPEDDVSYQAPQAILTYTRRFGNNALADAGFGRYAMKGSFGQSYTNVDYFQNVYFAGAQFAETPHDTVLLQIRRSAFAGEPSMLGGTPPNYRATTLVIEQRFQ
ncbi:MAG TPA: hypothetical protein VGZ02_10145 [Candidatus Baltobacteraceae bacterium]|jgi:hypothetical protein|nr:hypothetical protein [Candidatus Baltobacteraceae bacterium]